MIKGLGIDLVDVTRIAKIYKRFGAKFAYRFLGDEEINHIPPNPETWLAGRFAAKEAAAKALGTGFQKGVLWKDVLVLSDALGKPVLALSGNALQYADKLGIKKYFLSISHERCMATAIVIMED